jgi:AraC-like DNA-binding protein
MAIDPADFATTSQSTWRRSDASATQEWVVLAGVNLRPPARGGLPPRALQRVQQYIDAHLHESISVQTLADTAGLSMYHFARAFKRSEGLSPHDYLVQRRVHYTQKLLAESEMSLAEIALAAGFSDQSHFARRFREHVGVTPSRYRWSTR